MRRLVWIATLAAAVALSACGGGKAVKPDALAFTPTLQAKEQWHIRVGPAHGSIFTPLVDGDDVFVADAFGHIVHYAADSGKKYGVIRMGERLSGGIGGNKNFLLVGTRQGELVALDGKGKEFWRVQLTSELLSPPLLDSGMVVARSSDDHVYAIDQISSDIKWNYSRAVPSLTLRTSASMVIYRGGVITGFPSGRLVVLLMDSGTVAWEASVATPKGATELERMADVASTPVVSASQVCAVAFQGRIACFDLMNGNSQWAQDLSSAAGMTADDANLYVSDDAGNVVALERKAGAIVWIQPKLYGRRITEPKIIGDYLAVGDGQGYVTFLKRSNGDLAARVPTDGSAIIAAPVVTQHGVLVQTQHGGLYAINIQQ